jgi:hypothetical protein
MKSGVRWVALIAAILLAAPLVSTAQFRGLGRVTGTVTDENGTPLKDVAVRATMSGDDDHQIEEKSDDKGTWAINGMAKGEWHLIFHQAGYTPVGAKVVLVAELAHVNPITIVLKKAK